MWIGMYNGVSNLTKSKWVSDGDVGGGSTVLSAISRCAYRMESFCAQPTNLIFRSAIEMIIIIFILSSAKIGWKKVKKISLTKFVPRIYFLSITRIRSHDFRLWVELSRNTELRILEINFHLLVGVRIRKMMIVKFLFDSIDRPTDPTESSSSGTHSGTDCSRSLSVSQVDFFDFWKNFHPEK